MNLQDARALHNKLWGVGCWVMHNPVATPSSLGRADLPLLRRGYVATAKTDGERATLLLGSMENDPSYTYAVRFDRNGHCTPMGLKTKKVTVHTVRDADPCEGTLLDCEWLPGERKFVVLDAMALCGYDVKHVPDFQLRLRSARQVVSGIKLFDNANERIHICFKPFVGLHEMCELDPRGNADGLIFMPLHSPVQTGRSSTILKWKWCHTVDALWRDGTFWFGKGDKFVPCSDAGVINSARSVTHSATTMGTQLNDDLEENVVYELAPHKGGLYRVVKARRDKGPVPNQVDTAVAAVAHAREDLQFEEMVRIFCDKPSRPTAAT